MNEKNLKTFRLFSKIAKVYLLLTIVICLSGFIGSALDIISIDVPPFIFYPFVVGLCLSLLLLLFAAVIEYREAKFK